MLTKRIIPCLDVTLDRAGGCVVKGVEFVDLKEAGDLWSSPSVIMKTVRTSLFFWISQLPLTAGKP